MCYISWSARLTNVIWKSGSFMEIMWSAIQLITRCPACQLGWTSVVYSYVSLSGFLTVLSYLVFTTFLLCCVLILSPPCALYCFLYGVLPLSLQNIFEMLFYMCVLNVIAVSVDRPVCICLWVVLMCSSIAYSGSVCLFVCFVAW